MIPAVNCRIAVPNLFHWRLGAQGINTRHGNSLSAFITLHRLLDYAVNLRDDFGISAW